MPKTERKTTKNGRTERIELFCQSFAKDKDCFGNGTQAYLKAFPGSTYNTARVCASDLLARPDIVLRVRELIDIYVSNEVVDKELGTMILQYADFPTKVAAIREYNRVKGRLAPTQFKFVDNNDDLADEQVTEEINKREKSGESESQSPDASKTESA